MKYILWAALVAACFAQTSQYPRMSITNHGKYILTASVPDPEVPQLMLCVSDASNGQAPCKPAIPQPVPQELR